MHFLKSEKVKVKNDFHYGAEKIFKSTTYDFTLTFFENNDSHIIVISQGFAIID
jgi:hypothetical protein